MLRKFLAVIFGLIAGFVVVLLVETINLFLYPLPEGFDGTNRESMTEHIQNLPVAAFVIVLAAHLIGSFAAGFTCSAVTRGAWYPGVLTLGVLFLLAGLANVVMIPHPVWFAILDIAVYVPGALLGGFAGGKMLGTKAAASEAGPADPPA